MTYLETAAAIVLLDWLLVTAIRRFHRRPPMNMRAGV